MQLARGAVEEVNVKGHSLVLKVTSTVHGEKVVFLSFSETKDFKRWMRRCKKVSTTSLTNKIPLCLSCFFVLNRC